MRARHIPYAVGLFMLLPFVIWLVAFAFMPGPTHGLESPVSNAFFATSVPLVAWFFFANLGFLSNSIDGRNEYHAPRTGWVRFVIASLPPMAIGLGLTSMGYLLWVGEPALYAVVPALMGLSYAYVIRRGEAARLDDAAKARPGWRAPARIAHPLSPFGAIALKAVYLVPLFGWMLKEAVEGGLEERAYFGLALFVAAVLSIVLVGYPAFIVIVLSMVPCAFIALIAVTRLD